MIEWHTVALFASLFGGRPDAWFDGSKIMAIREPVSIKHFRDHLIGWKDIGTYPVYRGQCRWSCIDIDTEDLELAQDIAAAWASYGAIPWIETSKSKGYHVWLFHELIDARIARAAGLWISYLVTGETKLEVNPKGIPREGTGEIGNTVRLPYPGVRSPGRREVPSLDVGQWCQAAWATRSPLGALLTASRAWDRYKARAEAEAALEPSGGSLGGGSKAKQEAAMILRGERMVSQGERDNQFYTMARLLNADGTPYQEARQRIIDVWNRYVPNKDGYSVEQAIKKVERAYGR